MVTLKFNLIPQEDGVYVEIEKAMDKATAREMLVATSIILAYGEIAAENGVFQKDEPATH